mmetsp:Transcript_87080/g.241488  ORF Transcript_87080/g.241488 Transcript_87080/m.241488 type:complete len:90 (-) Transcript_87080:71-340(-)
MLVPFCGGRLQGQDGGMRRTDLLGTPCTGNGGKKKAQQQLNLIMDKADGTCLRTFSADLHTGQCTSGSGEDLRDYGDWGFMHRALSRHM